MSYPNITVLNRTSAIGLLTEDGTIGSRVIGAVGMETRTGRFIVCQAGAVIVTSGNSHRLSRHHDSMYAPSRFITVSPPTNCGEGQVMAYRAGADVLNMEFPYIARTWKDFSHAGCGQTGAGGKSITGTGATLSFDDRYKRTHQFAFNTEGPCYVDVTNVEGWPEDKGQMRHILWALESESTSPGYLLWMRERGEDLRKGPVELEWRPPGIHNNQSGVHIDVNAKSTLDGLYAAGDVAGGGWRYASGGAFVFGARAGKNAAEYAKKSRETKLNNEQVAAEKNRIIEALSMNPKDGYSWIELEDRVRKIATDYGPPCTNDPMLKQGLIHIERIKTRYLPKLYARDPREMMRAAEVDTIFTAVEMFLRAALFRKESRQNPCSILYKTEYPEQDDKNWLKHTVIRNKNGEMVLDTKEVRRLSKK